LGLAAYPPHDTEKALQEFAPQSDMITLIFGSRFHPGTLFFDDAPLCNEDREFFQAPQEADVFPVPQTQARTRVSLSRLTGTAQRKLLFSTEYGVPEMRFNGKIAGVLRGIPLIDAPATYSLILLLAALHVLEAIGGDKSLGAGRVTCRVTQLIVDSQEKHPAEYLDLLPQFEYYELAAEEEAR
jgi:CRISPR/Cas system CSM-associated protein Csm3 (group 7 of RAMP superfamily)